VFRLIRFNSFLASSFILLGKSFFNILAILILLVIPSISFSQIHDSTTVNGHKSINDSLRNNDLVNSDSIQTKNVRKLIPLQKDYTIFNFNDNIISQHQQQFKDYRFVGDLLAYLPYGNLLDLGWLGQPSEMKFYGLGYNNITYLSNGTDFNNRLTNSLDLNLLQSGNLDFIGVPALPRGFLFGNLNNPVTVYFQDSRTITKKPVTKIRYYQAKNEEAYINGVFKTRVYRDLYGTFQFTNTAIDNGYKNSDYSAWKASARLTYLFSDKVNFIAKYNHIRSYTGLFGGVNLESIKSMPGLTNPGDVLYNRILAPVNYTTRYQKITRHNFELETLLKFFSNSLTEISIYHQYHSTKFRQNEKHTLPTVKSIINDDDYTAYGVRFNHNHNFDYLNLNVFSNYERVNNKIVSYSQQDSNFSTHDYFYYGAVLSTKLFDGNLVPSFFAKQLYLINTHDLLNGFGSDLTLTLSKSAKFYLGYSKYSKPYFMFASEISRVFTNVNTFEFKFLVDSKTFRGSIGYFKLDKKTSLETVCRPANDSTIRVATIDFGLRRQITSNGINMNFNYNIWKLLAELNANYYFNAEEATVFAGLYYVDTLFQKNLHLKAGVNYRMFNLNSGVLYDFEKNISAPCPTLFQSSTLPIIVSSKNMLNQQFDIFIAGEIQEAATVYFVLENILDTKYYLVQYFPKQEITFRFGFSWEFLN